MQDWMLVFHGGLSLLPIMVIPAILLIAIQVYKLKQLGKQFADCTVRKGIVQEMGVREPTRLRPYRHCFVTCSFQNSSDLIEIPYESGDLNQAKVGDEIPMYFYANGSTTVVAFDENTVTKKIRQQILMVAVFCVVMSFFIPAVGVIAGKKFGS